MSTPTFFIKSGSLDFLSRQKSLFDSLDSAKKETNPSPQPAQDRMQIIENDSHKKQRKITKCFRGQESLFNKPVELPPRFRKRNAVPDFQRNPHKWTKYSLGDVTPDDMSNESNTAAAMTFLRDVKLQRRNSNIKMEVDEEITSEGGKPTTEFRAHEFNRSIKSEPKRENNVPETVQPSAESYFKNSKLVMAEYVVGQEKKPIKKKRVKVEKGKEIFLNHIHEYEDE